MARRRLLDLFCKAGGAAMGYHRAGYEVYGIDHLPQKHYPFPFMGIDALQAMDSLLRGQLLRFKKDGHIFILGIDDFSAIHASPPCQAYTRLTPPEYKSNHPDLIEPIKERLKATGKFYVIENVPDALFLLDNPLMLCGTMFNLPTHRHRYFEINPPYYPLLPRCHRIKCPIVVSGTTRRKTGRLEYRVAEVCKAMKIDWMNRKELDEAIPPAYTEYIGRYLLEIIDG